MQKRRRDPLLREADGLSRGPRDGLRGLADRAHGVVSAERADVQEAQLRVAQGFDQRVDLSGRVVRHRLGRKRRGVQREDGEIAGIAGQLHILCEKARPLGVDILLEVHGDINTSDRILKVADLTDSDNFGIIWDIQHSREDPVRFWNRTKRLVRHLHIKDSICSSLCPTGEGELPIAQIVRMLENDGYNGYYSLEWEKRWHPELRDAAEEFPLYVKLMKELVRDAQSRPAD